MTASEFVVNNPRYDAQYFIDKFTAIPESEWIQDGAVENFEYKRGALYHCGFKSWIDPYTPEQSALIELLTDRRTMFKRNGADYCRVCLSNVEEDPTKRNARLWPEMVYNYNQSSPRLRVLAALEDARKAGK